MIDSVLHLFKEIVFFNLDLFIFLVRGICLLALFCIMIFIDIMLVMAVVWGIGWVWKEVTEWLDYRRTIKCITADKESK